MAFKLKQKYPGFSNITLLDMAVLLYLMHKGAKHKQVGFEDTNETLEGMTKSLNRFVKIKTSKLESMLWSANLLDEANAFEHPLGLPFDTWLERMLGGRNRFDKFYNLLKKGDINHDD